MVAVGGGTFDLAQPSSCLTPHPSLFLVVLSADLSQQSSGASTISASRSLRSASAKAVVPRHEAFDHSKLTTASTYFELGWYCQTVREDYWLDVTL